MTFHKLKKESISKDETSAVSRDKIRKHIVFTGRVQGVGFRYRASYLARAREITGWVKNNWDGSVEMEAQGMEEQIDKMLISLQKESFIRIDRMDIKNIPIEERENGFHVRG